MRRRMVATAGAIVAALSVVGVVCAKQQQSSSFRQRITRTTATVHSKRKFGGERGQPQAIPESARRQRQQRQDRLHRRRQQVSPSTETGHSITVFDEDEAGMEASNRINNGFRSSPGKYTFFAQMWWSGVSQGCGGSLIGSKWIVTAAHCVEDLQFHNGYPEWRVHAYCTSSDNCGETYQVVRSKAGHIHPQYDAPIPKYDYALIELQEEVRSDVAVPVHIELDGSLTGQLTTGNPVRGIGMGYVNNAGTFSTHLLEVDNHFLATASCARYFTTGPHFDDSIMCTNGANFGMCSGDSGSPVLLPDDSTPHGFRQISVTSFGPPFCENHNYPDGSAKLSTVAQWIKDTICPSYSLGDSARPHYCDGTGFIGATPPPPPTSNPSPSPTLKPTPSPTHNPTHMPSLIPTHKPISNPTQKPVLNPTSQPSLNLTPSPSMTPSLNPTPHPSTSPTLKPSAPPTLKPSLPPSLSPTDQPSAQPTMQRDPTLPPSPGPTTSPTIKPSFAPTVAPSLAPSPSPTAAPSLAPSTFGIVDPRSDFAPADTDSEARAECMEKETSEFFDHKKDKVRDCEKIRKKLKNYVKYCSDRTTAKDHCPVSCNVCDGTLLR